MGDVDARWVLAESDGARAAELAAAIGVKPLTAQLLLNRGVADAERARKYLAPRLAELRRPDGMAGFPRALDRLDAALSAGEVVGVFGDYDVDGVTSCALLTRFLRDAGGRVVPRVASRDAGYGFGPADVDAFAAAGCAVVVTCDLGTSDHEALAAARARGLDVIVVDHHQVPEREPDAYALINPHQPACRFPFKGLASVGVAFYLAAALRTRLRDRGRGQDVPDPRDLLDLVAVGTVADMAPLVDENRILVAHGLDRLRARPRPGLRALALSAGLDSGVRHAADISLRLAPRLNAPGRLGAARLALDLLLAEDDARATELAAAIEDENRRRREVTEDVMREALEQVDPNAGVLLVAGQGWHPGVVGIVAAKLTERFARPSVAVALDGDRGRGSARTVGGFDLYRAFASCADLLERYGGHKAAAGLTVETRRLGELRTRLQAAAESALGDGPRARELRVDAEVGLDAVDEPFAEEVRRLEPFGVGNPEPCLAARGVTLAETRVVGERHLQVTLSDGAHAVGGIGFNFAERAPDLGARVRAAFFPELDTFRGVTRVRVRLRDLVAE
jgi:single-stranded-DNA-specific exonuclease